LAAGRTILKEEVMAVSELQSWLGFLSTFLWQMLVLFVLLMFRSELRALLRKLAKLKFGETEFIFQLAEPGAVPLPKEALLRTAVTLVGEGGFLSVEGIRQIALSSVEVGDEIVNGMLMIFETPRQRTWLVATTLNLVCILDDEKTRASGRLIQWKLDLKKTEPIFARPDKGLVGLLDIGERKNWLYSRDLFSSPEELERHVKSLVRRV
jgi:hypothetical protein